MCGNFYDFYSSPIFTRENPKTWKNAQLQEAISWEPSWENSEPILKTRYNQGYNICLNHYRRKKVHLPISYTLHMCCSPGYVVPKMHPFALQLQAVSDTHETFLSLFGYLYRKNAQIWDKNLIYIIFHSICLSVQLFSTPVSPFA